MPGGESSPLLTSGTGATEVSANPRHRAPAKKEKAEERECDHDERGRGTLASQHPDHHASTGRARPGAKRRPARPPAAGAST